MSIKQQFAEAVDDLPECATVEEAFDHLYRAFRQRQIRAGGAPDKKEVLSGLYGSLRNDPLARPAQGTLECRDEIP